MSSLVVVYEQGLKGRWHRAPRQIARVSGGWKGPDKHHLGVEFYIPVSSTIARASLDVSNADRDACNRFLKRHTPKTRTEIDYWEGHR